jgi:hypothetical protein
VNNFLTNDEIQRYAPSAFAGQPYHEVSERYTFVPTSDVIDGMRNAGFMPVMACQSRTRIAGKENFTKHMIRFRSANESAITVGDSLVETVLINSHDRTSSYHLMLGVFRLVCSNGMVVGDTFEGIHVRHVGNIVEAIVDANIRMLKNAPIIADTIRLWRSIMLTAGEQLALATAAHQLRFDEGTDEAQLVKPDQLLSAHRSADQSSDLYTTFNRIQENTVRGRVRGSGYVQSETGNRFRRLRTRAVTGIDNNTKLNKALWTLAEEMAKLKA